MSYRPYSPEMARALDAARPCLILALRMAMRADCPSLTRKIKSALKSHEGASRHMRHRKFHATPAT